MRLLAVSVFDVAVNSFLPPFFVRTKGEAIRMFVDTCSDGKTNFARHPEDYRLAILDEWDDQSGVFMSGNKSAIEWLMTAKEAIAPGLDAAPPEPIGRA